jgi:hypothetical protein
MIPFLFFYILVTKYLALEGKNPVKWNCPPALVGSVGFN